MTWPQFGKVRGMTKGNPGIMLYWEMFDVLDRVKPEKVKILLQAMRNLAQHGVLPDFREDEALELVWPLIEQKIMVDRERYEKIRKQRADAINARWEKERAKAASDNGSIQPYTGVYESERNIPATTESTSATATVAGASATGAKKPARSAYGLYKNVFLTVEEHAGLQRDIPDLDRTIDKLSLHMQSTGRQYASHEATVRKWAMEDAEKQATARPVGDWCTQTNRTPYSAAYQNIDPALLED